jgi:exopolysaccharide biosynthesis WecB/TagA/CpsF family protein
VGGFLKIAERFGTNEYEFAVTPNVDHVIRFCDDPSFRALYTAAQFVLMDSRFLARILRIASGLSLQTCTGSDVTAGLFRHVIQPDDKVVVIGSTPAQAQSLRRQFALRNLQHLNPPMGLLRNAEAIEATLRFVEEQSPFRFCLLAVGSPQQEILAQALKTRGRAKGLALCIGASIDFLTGGERRAPRWMQVFGVEWLFRLAQNPTRLAGRYLVRGPRIFLLLPRLKIYVRPTLTNAADVSRS